MRVVLRIITEEGRPTLNTGSPIPWAEVSDRIQSEQGKGRWAPACISLFFLTRNDVTSDSILLPPWRRCHTRLSTPEKQAKPFPSFNCTHQGILSQKWENYSTSNIYHNFVSQGCCERSYSFWFPPPAVQRADHSFLAPLWTHNSCPHINRQGNLSNIYQTMKKKEYFFFLK